MRLIRNKICRRRFKIQFRVRKWLFGGKKKSPKPILTKKS